MKINIGNNDKPNIADRFRPPLPDRDRRGVGSMVRNIIEDVPEDVETNIETNIESEGAEDEQ